MVVKPLRNSSGLCNCCGVDGAAKLGFYESMDVIKVFPKGAGESWWEFSVIVGPDSRAVGFSVKLEKQYWRNLTGGVCSPEKLTRLTIDFLLRKKGSPFALDRIIAIQNIPSQFSDYEEEIRKKLVGGFGL